MSLLSRPTGSSGSTGAPSLPSQIFLTIQSQPFPFSEMNLPRLTLRCRKLLATPASSMQMHGAFSSCLPLAFLVGKGGRWGSWSERFLQQGSLEVVRIRAGSKYVFADIRLRAIRDVLKRLYYIACVCCEAVVVKLEMNSCHESREDSEFSILLIPRAPLIILFCKPISATEPLR